MAQVQSSAKKKLRLALAGAALLLLVFSTASLKLTSATAFCLSCHEMQPHAQDLKFSTHAKDKDGIPINCNQCHIPHDIGPDYLAVKIYSGVKDLYVHFFGDPDSLDRIAMQKDARRFLDDKNCLACHEDLMKDAKGKEKVSELGEIAHNAYLGKNGRVRNGCADCHVNIAHLPEFDSHLVVNEPFRSRIQKQEEYR